MLCKNISYYKCDTILDIADLKTDNTTIASDKIANYTNGSMIVEVKNITNRSDNSSDDYVNFPSTKKTNSAPPSDKELDDYYDVSTLRRIQTFTVQWIELIIVYSITFDCAGRVATMVYYS